VRVALAGVVLVAAFVGALLIGKGGGGGEPEASAPADVKALTAPSGSTKAPRLADTGGVPALQTTPEPASTSSTTATGGTAQSTAPSATSTGGSTGSTGGSTGGGGNTPQVRPPG
jgi:hypothetical protein